MPSASVCIARAEEVSDATGVQRLRPASRNCGGRTAWLAPAGAFDTVLKVPRQAPLAEARSMNATGHPAPLRHLCAALVLVFGPLLAGCGGGGDSGGSNSTVEEVLADLGVDTTETPRVDEHGNPLGDEYAPMGDRSTVNRFAEVVAIGVPFDDDSQSQAAVMNLVPGASNTYAWDSPLQQPTDAELPWASATMRRAATYGDFDGDGLEELAVVYQTDGDVMLVRTDDAGASFAQS
ncbi:MAG: hypothetical protein KC621_11020, partial [Myxococcales bacterium]|nr:hypothetical protein [Myxococcales bacterium]